ncbi:unnamed protein product [Heterobilharzia americana]|nr:unnamed protein product [Heterobilharzia americana]
MWSFESHVKIFQLKLSNYDKHPWEHNVEQRILQGIDQHSAHEGKARTGLIDVDVIRGSVFAKAKPRHGWMAAVRLGLLRVAFAPFYWNYWRGHTSFCVAVYIMVHFFLQFLQVVFFLLTDPRTSNSSQDDVLLPCLLAICLGILHAHITAPHGKAGSYSSFIDSPMTAQSFKDIGDSQVYNLNPSSYHHYSDNLVNNKLGSLQNNIRRLDECDHSSQLSAHLVNSEHRQCLNNACSLTHQSNSQPFSNKEYVDNTEHPDYLANSCSEFHNSTNVICRNYGKLQRNIQWRSGDTESKKPLASSHKCYEVCPNSSYHDEFSTVYSPGDNKKHELNDSDVTYEMNGPQSPYAFEEDRGQTKHFHSSQLLEHRPRVIRRRRRQNSYSSKHGNLSRGHDADVEESEGEVETVSNKNNVDSATFDGQSFSLQTVNDVLPEFISRSNSKGSVNQAVSLDCQLTLPNTELNLKSRSLPKEEESVFLSKSSNALADVKLPENLSEGSSINSEACELTHSKTKVTYNSFIPLKVQRKQNENFIYLLNNDEVLRKAFSDAVINHPIFFDSSNYQSLSYDNKKDLRKSFFQQKQSFKRKYDTENEARAAYNLLPVNQQDHFSTENVSYRKISLSSHSSAATESSTNSGRSFSCLRKYPKRSGRHFELESVHGIGAELTANPKCVDSHFDRKMHSSYNDILDTQINEDKKPMVQSVELCKEFEKQLDWLDEKHANHEVKNKSYEFINKDDTITVYNRQRAKYLRLFYNTDAELLDSETAMLNNKRPLANSKHSSKYLSSFTNVDMNFKPSIHRISGSTVTNKSCLKSTSQRVFYNCCDDDSSFGNTSNRITTANITNTQGAGIHEPRRNMNQYLDPISGFVHDTYSRSHYLSKSESHDANMNTRGQTASETEYFDRINSDLGSDIDSSSCPDEVEAPSPPPCENELQNWQNSNTKPNVNIVPAQEIKIISKKQVSRHSTYGFHNAKSYCHKCCSRRNVSVSSNTDSGPPNSVEESNGIMNNNDHKSIESQELSGASPTSSVNIVAKGGKYVSNIQEEVLHSIVFEQNDKQLNDETAKQNFRNIHPKSNLTRDSYGYENLPSVKHDTVRCYMWAGDKLSKFNLSMLDIGKNVIYAVERQSVSSDYIVLACIATFLLPFIAVIFHSTNSIDASGILTISSSSVQSNEELKSTFITENTQLFLENNSVNQTLFTNLFDSANSVFGNTVIGLYLRAIISIFTHLLGTVLLKMQSLVIGVDVQASNCSQPYCIIFWNIVTGQFLMNWFSKPDIQGRLVILIGFILRFNVYGTIFFLLCIAERTFQERLLYAKYFFSLTSGRRALKYRVPQFRLNKIGHIKCWLMLRSYLKKRGPQRSVENIMATAFYIVFTLGLSLCAQLLSKSRGSVFVKLTNWDIFGLTFGIVIFLYRFILLGTKITKKYRNFSVLITEQINLYLSMESKPHKKEDLMLTFQVLRLVESLLKEVDGPFRVCGWTLNPLVYNIFKLVLLSCVSSLLSESLGFKLKLYKLKLNPSNW